MLFKETEFRDRCKLRGLDAEAVENSLAAVRKMEAALLASGKLKSGETLVRAGLAAVEEYIENRLAHDSAIETDLMAYARYFTVIGSDAIAIRLLAYLLPIGVLPAMAERLESMQGKNAAAAVLRAVSMPKPGCRPERYPESTTAFVNALKAELGEERARKVLAWNVHGIPAAAFAAEHELFLDAASIDDWLAGFHARQVAVLEKHAADGTLWFEQKITPAVVEFVRNSPEILGGVREGDTIYATKIPYDPDRYLREEDPVAKRRLACHCPLAASSIHEGGAGVPTLWCSCSAGYEKFMFDIVFGEETEAAVLQSALDGGMICRFAVKIPAKVLLKYRGSVGF